MSHQQFYFQRLSGTMRSLNETVSLKNAQVVNERRYRAVLCQRRLMAVMTVASFLSAVVFIVALATPNWATIDFDNAEGHRVHVQLGVFGEWRTVENGTAKNGTAFPFRRFIQLFALKLPRRLRDSNQTEKTISISRNL